MCYRRGCAVAGSGGPDGLAYCPQHIATAATPPPPVPRVKSPPEYGDNTQGRPKDGHGVASIPDVALMELLGNLKPHVSRI